MKKSLLMIWLLLCLMLQSCEKINEIYQTIDPSKQFQSSHAQDAKAKMLYRALQSYDSTKLKPLLNASLKQEIEQSPVAMIDVFKLIPEGKATFGKLDHAQQSHSDDVGDMTTQVYSFEYVDLTIALTIVFKGHTGGDEILAFTLDQIQNDQPTHKVGVTPTIQADAIAMELPKTGLQDNATSSQALAASSEIEELLAKSRAFTTDLNAEQKFNSLQEKSNKQIAGHAGQVEALTLKQPDRLTESNIQLDVEKQTQAQQINHSKPKKTQVIDLSAAMPNKDPVEPQSKPAHQNLQLHSQQNHAPQNQSQDVNQDINKIMTEVAEAKASAKQSFRTDVDVQIQKKLSAQNTNKDKVNDIKDDKAESKQDVNQSELNKGEAKDVLNSEKSSELVELRQSDALQQNKEQPKEPAPKDQLQKLNLKAIESELNELKD